MVEGAATNYESSSSSNSNKKLWFLVGGATLIVILFVIGGYFVVKALVGGGNVIPEYNVPSNSNGGNVAVNNQANTSNQGSNLSTPNNPATEPSSDGQQSPSLDSLLENAENESQSSQGGSSEVSVSVNSLTCSEETVSFDVLVNSGSFEALIFNVTDGSLGYPFSRWVPMKKGESNSFSLEVSGRPLNLDSVKLEVYLWDASGNNVLLETKDC